MAGEGYATIGRPCPRPLPTRVHREQRDDGRDGARLDDSAGKRLVLKWGGGICVG